MAREYDMVISYRILQEIFGAESSPFCSVSFQSHCYLRAAEFVLEGVRQAFSLAAEVSAEVSGSLEYSDLSKRHLSADRDADS